MPSSVPRTSSAVLTDYKSRMQSMDGSICRLRVEKNEVFCDRPGMCWVECADVFVRPEGISSLDCSTESLDDRGLEN